MAWGCEPSAPLHTRTPAHCNTCKSSCEPNVIMADTNGTAKLSIVVVVAISIAAIEIGIVKVMVTAAMKRKTH